ncbi:hypothetical protein [Flavobacterium chilense]|uniref:Uncharacterized protein n=1 Tax=Flavobacterium chilense TaxID=946677 RepID=A0A1M7D2Y3_9FLAO|nr:MULTISPECIES: hypothetical protein [Flavobacterium]SHL73795.1 hypothetical protein SAMN05444484_102403 [Flavobacterium chilense]
MNIKAVFLENPLTKNANLNDYKSYFLNYKDEDWEYSNSGSFEYNRNDGQKIILFFVNYINHGFSFRYDYNIPNAREGQSWYSVNDKSSMDIIVDAGDETLIPQGSCLSLKLAWEIICDFFENPNQKSNKTSWMNSNQIDWSDAESKYW